jgi:hypothetical protein
MSKKSDPVYSIKTEVLKRLGKPKDYLETTVYNVYNDKYRVNIYRRTPDGGAKISDSFFITSNKQGDILLAQPPIQKLY